MAKAEPAELPDLLARLGERTLYFLEQRLHLLEGELRDQLRNAAGMAARFAVALALAVIGLGLLLTALVFLLGRLGLPPWALFLGIGVLCLGGSLALVAGAARRFPVATRFFPLTLGELRKDRAMLRGKP